MEHYLTWNYFIAVYLFMAGLSSGSALIASIGEITGKLDERIWRIGTYLAPFPVLIGLLCLVLDLHRPWNFYQVLIHYHITSVMSWGAFFLLVFPLTAMVNAAFVYWNIQGLLRRISTWVNLILGIAIGIYAGLLLAAIYSNPVWSNPIIALLFLVSAVSTGLCMILLAGKWWDQLEKYTLRKLLPASWLPKETSLNFDPGVSSAVVKIDAVVIILELLVILTLLISQALAPTGDIALGILSNGLYGWLFWGGVVLLGLVIPLIMCGMELKPQPSKLPSHKLGVLEPGFVLVGGFLLRFVIVYAGQVVYPILTYYK